jgi:sugar phosphate isomerase/epimerase
MSGSSVMMLPPIEALKIAIENGFQAFELFGEFPQCVCEEFDTEAREKMRSIAESAGIPIAVHAPFNSLNIAALNPGIRRESVRQHLDAVDLCADLGGGSVIAHNGSYVTSKKIRKNLPEAEQFQWNLNVESLKTITKRAEERNVSLCLENVGFEPSLIDSSVDDMLRIREEVASPAMAFCIDIGHARLNGELDNVLERMGPLTQHIHITDNFGEDDDHVAIGDGNFDYRPHLQFFMAFEHIITLEVTAIGTDPAAAIRSKKYVDRLLASKA